MKEINVLMVVDVEGALASNNLTANIYLIDTNKYFGSGSEGQAELVTACNDGQIVIWSVAAVNPGNDVEIVSFGGQIITENVCNPRKSELPGGAVIWSGRVETQGKTQKYQYNCTLSMDGKSLTFDPFLNVKAD
jgi:hypothetical protein